MPAIYDLLSEPIHPNFGTFLLSVRPWTDEHHHWDFPGDTELSYVAWMNLVVKRLERGVEQSIDAMLEIDKSIDDQSQKFHARTKSAMRNFFKKSGVSYDSRFSNGRCPCGSGKIFKKCCGKN